MKLFKKNRLSNNKGITIIFVALLAFVLFAFAALAVDVAYFYVAKNELQVVADAAALAGAARLSDTSSLTQNTARDEAVNFAKKNKVVGKSLTISNSGGNSLGNNNDITVGNWNGTIYTAGVTPVNAVQVRTRRTENSPDGPVGVFFGRFLGWELMNIRAEAIASMPPRAGTYFSICNDLSLINPPCRYPNTCPIVPPRTLETGECDTSVTDPTNPNSCGRRMSWTSLLSSPPATSGFTTSICQNLPFQEVCGASINNFPGTSAETFKALESAMYNPNYDVSNKTIVAGVVQTWTVIVPVTRDCPPGGSAPKAVWGYARLRLTRVCGSGGGNACNPLPTYDAPPGICPGGEKSIVIDSISSIECGQQGGGLKPALVR